MRSVLQQFHENNWKPIAFYSKKFSDAQRYHSTYDRKLLAIYNSIKYFRHFIESRQLVIRTNHKPLIYAFHQKSNKATPRQLRHLDLIGQFIIDIRYIKGTENIVVDSFSRLKEIEMPTIGTTKQIIKEQKTDSELHELVQNPSTTSLILRKIHLSDVNDTLFCDISGNDVRPYIPKTLRRQVFDTVYNLPRSNGCNTLKTLTAKFIWSSIKKDTKEWARQCLQCQRSKIHRHTRNPPLHTAIPNSRFQHVHIDVIGSLSEIQNDK